MLRTLDARISEWIHLTLDSSETWKGSDEPEVKRKDFANQTFDMYLPFTVDDPTRATSWNLSIPIRKLAYSILRPGKHITNEWTRRGPRIGEKKVEHVSTQEVCDGVQEWIHFLLPLQTELSEAVALWRVIGLYSVCMELIEQERPLPKREVLAKLLTCKVGSRDWSSVHLQTQMEAVLYSWRMIHQCCQVQQAMRKDATPNDELDGVVDGLSDILASMPGIAHLFDTKLANEKVFECAMEQLYGLISVGEDESKPEQKEYEDGFRAASKKRRKRKKDELKSKLPATKAAKIPKASNLFDVLGVDR